MAIELYYGRRGFMPIDQATVFDGGWRTLSGQVPFRDYTTPNAILPSLIQGAFFWALDVSWSTYLLHAALFNALFTLVVYAFLRLCGGGRVVALFYAALSAVVFYPPIGVPFHDQHSFFFVLLAITLAVAARRAEGPRAERVLWASVPFALVASALSKQTPMAIGVPVILTLLLTHRRFRAALLSVAAGMAGALIVLVGAAFAVGVDWRLAWVYFVELPLQTGQSRAGDADTATIGLVVLAAMFVLVVAAPSVLLGRARRGRARLARGAGLPLALACGLLLMSAAFTTLTLNEPSEGMSLFFAAVGLFHVAVSKALPTSLIVGPLRPAAVADATLVVLSLLGGWTFNANVNVHRGVNNLYFREASVETETPPGLSYMRFQVPDRYGGLHARDLRDVVDYVRRADGNFVLIGDTTVISGLAGKPTMFPALFVTAALTYPERGDPELVRFERRLVERMASEDVRRVVIERRTWESVTLADFPQLESIVRRCEASTRRLGFFEIVELAERSGCP